MLDFGRIIFKDMSIFAGKTLMITGGTGSFGNAVLKQVTSCDFFLVERLLVLL